MQLLLRRTFKASVCGFGLLLTLARARAGHGAFETPLGGREAASGNYSPWVPLPPAAPSWFREVTRLSQDPNVSFLFSRMLSLLV